MDEYLQASQGAAIGDLLRTEYQRIRGGGGIEISPENIAVNVYRILDPEASAVDSIRGLAICELMQRSRALCRVRHIVDQAEHESKQGNLFQLQDYYPVKREDRDVYVRRQNLTHIEWKENEARLRQEGQAKIRHADAIAAEVDRLVHAGQLVLPMECGQGDGAQA